MKEEIILEGTISAFDFDIEISEAVYPKIGIMGFGCFLLYGI